MNTRYAIAILPNEYESGVPGGQVRFLADETSCGHVPIYYYDTIDEAKSAIEEEEDGIYVTNNNEAGAPEYIIVEESIADYINSGRDGDMGAYNWDDCDCGECNDCIQLMIDQDRDYIRAFEIDSDE